MTWPTQRSVSMHGRVDPPAILTPLVNALSAGRLGMATKSGMQSIGEPNRVDKKVGLALIGALSLKSTSPSDCADAALVFTSTPTAPVLAVHAWQKC